MAKEKEKRRVKAKDLYKFQTVSDPQISPDGEHIVYCVQRVDRSNEKKYVNLWVVPTKGGKPRQFTYGNHRDNHPRWSPDGRSIAFLSNRQDEKQAQIFVIPFDGGEARPVTQMQGAFLDFSWSPDGERFACLFVKKDEEAIEREKDEQKKKLGVVERHITRVFFKADGQGFLPKERAHIWTVKVKNGKAKQLTSGFEYEEDMPVWTPDGEALLFTSNRSDNPDFDIDTTDLYMIPADGGELRKIETDHEFQKFMPSISPDGQWIAYLGREFAGFFGQNSCLYVVPAGGGEARNLTTEHDLHLSSVTLGDVSGSPAMTPLLWSQDSQQIYFTASRQGEQPLYAISREGGEPRLVVSGGVNGPFSLDKAQRKVAYVHATMTDPGEVWVQDLESGEARQLSNHNRRLMRRLDLGEIEEVWFKGRDGHDLQGWILKPPGFSPDKQYPSILEIHGGPQMAYGHAFMHEFYFLAAHGYVVYFSNPRGSQSYGSDHSMAIYNNWGTVDYEDVMAWADYVADLPYIDTSRMGVTGGSYGGYMTTTIIGRTDRFKAAVAQRLVSNMISMWGSSDFNWIWTRAMGNETPWENLENYWRQSPISTIGNTRTPTLIIHSERDFRCNLEQAEQVYVALKKLGVDTELVLFPEESHGLSRGGRTDRRVARLKHILRWFDKYLKE